MSSKQLYTTVCEKRKNNVEKKLNKHNTTQTNIEIVVSRKLEHEKSDTVSTG